MSESFHSSEPFGNVVIVQVKKLILGLCIPGLAAAYPDISKPTTGTAEQIVGPCRFRIANMYGGEFRAPRPDSSPPHQGTYYLPVTGPTAFLAGGFGMFCVEATNDRITSALNAKYVDGRWQRYGLDGGPEFVPFEKEANARTVSMKGRNWAGIAYIEDDTTGDQRRRARIFHFCLIHNVHALCGNAPVKWLADRNARSDLCRMRTILESVEFVDPRAPRGASAADTFDAPPAARPAQP